MLKILQSMNEVETSRASLDARSLSHLVPPRPRSFWDRFRPPRLVVGDKLKSWDVRLIADTLDAHVDKNDPILDMGAYCSEILLVLQALGFQRLTGVDLNTDVRRMPRADKIHYDVGDFTKTAYESATFGAITSVSAIEHGNSVVSLMREVARLLKPGGLFAASTDYWPEKIPTEGISMFGMSWRIFSREEIEELFRSAGEIGLVPLGPCDYEATGRPIQCADRNYTFATLFLRKVG